MVLYIEHMFDSMRGMETTEVDALEAELLLAAARLHADHAAVEELLERLDELDVSR